VVASKFSHTGKCMTVMHVRALAALMCEHLPSLRPLGTGSWHNQQGHGRQKHWSVRTKSKRNEPTAMKQH
jgi:hypothetical protein